MAAQSGGPERSVIGQRVDRLLGEPAAAPAPRPQGRRARFAWWLSAVLPGQAAGFALSPLVRLYAAPFLLAGTLLLTIGWLHGPQAWLEASRLQAYTQRLDGTLAESWIALDIDVDHVGDSGYWERDARARACIVVNAAGEWGPPVQRAFCGDRFAFSETDAALLDQVVPGVPFAWPRDTRGIPVPELRTSDRARSFLATHAADPAGLPSVQPPATAFAALRLHMDRSLLERAIRGWMQPSASIPLALDPAHPDEVLPAALVEGRSRARWAVALIALPTGLYLWWCGMAALMTGLPRAPRRLATIAPLCLLPWWAGHVPEMVARVSPEAAPIAADLLDDLTHGVALRASPPARALLADGARLTFPLEQGAYAETLGPAMPHPPARATTDADAALRAIADGIAARVRAFDADSRAALFARLRGDAQSGRRDVGIAFLPAAREAMLDAQADPAVARAAHDFLVAWLLQPPPAPARGGIAAATRRAFHLALRDIGDTRIAAGADAAAAATR